MKALKVTEGLYINMDAIASVDFLENTIELQLMVTVKRASGRYEISIEGRLPAYLDHNFVSEEEFQRIRREIEGYMGI